MNYKRSLPPERQSAFSCNLKAENRLATRDQAPLKGENVVFWPLRTLLAQKPRFQLPRRAWSRLLNGFRGQAPKTNRPLGRSRLFAGAGVCFGSPVSIIFAGAKSDFDAPDVHLSHSKNHYQSSPAEGALARLNVFGARATDSLSSAA